MVSTLLKIQRNSSSWNSKKKSNVSGVNPKEENNGNIKDVNKRILDLINFPEWGTWLNEEIEREEVKPGNIQGVVVRCTGIWLKSEKVLTSYVTYGVELVNVATATENEKLVTKCTYEWPPNLQTKLTYTTIRNRSI